MAKINIAGKIADLVKKLTAAKDAYYNGTPLMDDATFDALEDDLRDLDPTNAFFKKVGAPAPVGGAWPKVKHGIPMTSLNKAQNRNDLEAWFKACGLKDECVFVTDKCDGMSIELSYVNHVLVRAATRGDGREGENILRNVNLMKGVVKKLLPKVLGFTVPPKVFIRGEVVVRKSDFATYFPGESNPRNTATGTAKRQSDNEPCEYLTVLCYQYLPDGRPLNAKTEEFSMLSALGFSTPSSHALSSIKEVEDLYASYQKTDRDALDYLIDGLVIEINEAAKREAQGYTNDNPQGAVAYKFPHEKRPTILRDIRWQVGSSGRCTPVAEFDEVVLAGAKVKQASLHNISNITDLANAFHKGTAILRRGDKIMVSRRNDVIPYVEAVLGSDDKNVELKTPTACPVCKSSLSRDGEYLVCTSDACPAQSSGAIKRWITKIGVLHFGDALVDALVDAKLIEDPADLYKLDPAVVANMHMGGRRIGGTAEKAIRNLQAKKSLSLHVFIGSLGIPLIGRDMAKRIADAGYSVDAMLKADKAAIAKIPGLGPTQAESFVEGIAKRASLIKKLLAVGVQIEVATGNLVGKSFCMTGFRDADLASAIERVGGTIKSGVSRGLTYLIAADPTSSSGKAQKAREYSTEVIGVAEAWKLAGG